MIKLLLASSVLWAWATATSSLIYVPLVLALMTWNFFHPLKLISERFVCAFILISFEAASQSALVLTPRDDSYFLVCGAFALAIIPAFRIAGANALTRDLTLLALAGLVVQFVGLLNYWFFVTPLIYNALIGILLTAQFLRLLIKRENDDIRDDAHSPRNPLFPCDCAGCGSADSEKTK